MTHHDYALKNYFVMRLSCQAEGELIEFDIKHLSVKLL